MYQANIEEVYQESMNQIVAQEASTCQLRLETQHSQFTHMLQVLIGDQQKLHQNLVEPMLEVLSDITDSVSHQSQNFTRTVAKSGALRRSRRSVRP